LHLNSRDPEAFVRSIFALASARTSRRRYWKNLDILNGGDGAEAIYSASLLDAIWRREDETLGGLEWARICGLRKERDNAGADYLVSGCSYSTLYQLSIRPLSATTCDASVILGSAQKGQSITLHLIKTPGGWRVDDVSTPTGPDLKGYLMHQYDGKKPEPTPAKLAFPSVRGGRVEVAARSDHQGWADVAQPGAKAPDYSGMAECPG
jgi:hypothetical protein